LPGLRLETVLGYRFRDPDLLRRALRHSSAGGRCDNERLEFLGDAVLELLVRRSLLRRFPDAVEGELTRRKIALVRTGSLADAAGRIGLEGEIEVGAGLARGGSLPQSVLAGAVEAVLGAAFLDGGLPGAAAVMDAAGLAPEGGRSGGVPLSPKSELQELAQSRGRDVPTYRVLRRTGPDHRPRFEVEVSAGEGLTARGSGGSIVEAESEAARRAVAALKREEQRGLPPFRGP
jgi:ribonuclease-3